MCTICEPSLGDCWLQEGYYFYVQKHIHVHHDQQCRVLQKNITGKKKLITAQIVNNMEK